MNKAAVAIIVLAALGLVAGASEAKSKRVDGYFKSNGTYVAPHYRTTPDSNPYNNYSTPGNLNPNNGAITSGSQPNYLSDSYSSPTTGSGYGSVGSGQPVWVDGYTRADGTWVNGYWRYK